MRISHRYFRVFQVLQAFTLGLLFSSLGVRVSEAAVTVTDVRGRTVTLPSQASRLLIDDGRFLVALSLIHKDPVSVIAAWPHDVNRIGDDVYQRLKAKNATIETLPQVASSAGTFSLERVLAVKPDVAVFSFGRGPTDPQVAQIEAAGIPVVFIDFFIHPFQNLEPSLIALGQLVGRDAQAKAFVDFRRQHLDRIAARVKGAGGARPKVFLETHAGISAECCNSPGKGNVGDYITFVGGHNIGADVLPGAAGRLQVEYVIAQDPAVYILTGGPHLEKTGGFVVGPGYDVDRSRKSLTAMTARPALSQLQAVRAGRVFGLSHQLLNSPLDLLAVEALAAWIRPDLFTGLDPAATLREINTKFLSLPLEGAHWVSLR
jgi:iron complex transport system substrate-binding protein